MDDIKKDAPLDSEAPAEETAAVQTPPEEAPAGEIPPEQPPAEEAPAGEMPPEQPPAQEPPKEETPAAQNPEPEAAPVKPKRTPMTPEQRKRVLRWVLRGGSIAVTLLLILLAVFLVLNRSRLNLDGLKRTLAYRSLERSDDGTTSTFSIGQEEEVCYVTLSDAVILCSENRIQLFSDSGVQYEDISTVMKAPVAQYNGNNAVVYDAGGSELYLFADRQCIYRYSTQQGYSLISARVNARGWLCVVEQASGYKGSVTVYDASQEPVLTVNISSQFVMDAAISPDCKRVGIITISSGETSFAATLNIYQTNQEEPEETVPVAETPILDMDWDEEGLWLQYEHGIIRLNSQYRKISDWANRSLHLQGYTLCGDGFAVEYFSRDRSGALGQLISVDRDGKVLGTMNLSREVLSLTACGRYIAVLTNAQLTIYTPDFTEYATLPNTSGILTALVRSDGTALLIEGESAGVFLP